MTIKAQPPKFATLNDKQLVYVAFSTKSYEEGNILTVHHGAPGTPEFGKFTRCMLIGIEKQEVHDMNEWGFVITEQWWNFKHIPERDYLGHKRAMENNQGQQSLF